jgi:cobalt/nickel transport system permease protein
MHANFLDPYQERSSPIHHLDARIKLVMVVLFILTSALTPIGAWPVYFLLLALILSAELLSDLGLPFYLKRALLAIPFILAALPVLLTTSGDALLALPFGLSLTLPGLNKFLSIAFKSWISIQAAILLATTTEFPDILLSMRALRLPRLLVAIIGLMWRYLFVIVDEVLRLLRARASRSAQSEQAGLRTGGSLLWRAGVTGRMAGSLFLRSLERSDRIYNAMLARGYDGEVRSLPRPALKRMDWIVFAFGLTVLVLLLMFGLIVWG